MPPKSHSLEPSKANPPSKPVGRFNRPKLAQKVKSLTLSTPEDLARMTKCAITVPSFTCELPPASLLPPAALASALNKTGAFAKTSITPASASGAGSPSDLLAMTARLKELMDPANPNCLPPPPAEGSGGAPVPSDDDMLNVAQMLYALAPRSSDGNSMSYLNHGCECHAAGDYEQAIELYVKALNVRLQFFGANSLPVGQVYSLVAHTLHAAGEIDDAEEFYALALDIRADMLRSLEQKGLGGDFLPLATAAHAIEYNNCAPISLRGTGSELISHEIVAAAAASVNHDMPGDIVRRYPDTPPSARLLEVIHEDMYCEQYTGPMSPERRTLLETACEAQRSAMKLAQEGKMEQAIVGYHHVRELAAQLLGPRCLDVAQSYADIGCAYNALGQHDRALEFHSKAYIIQKENLGPRNKYLAATCNCLGTSMANREDLSQAFAHYITALDIRLDEFPDFSGSSDVACSLDNIGSMLKLELEVERALLYFAQSLEVQFQTLGPRHSQQAITFCNIADAYQKMMKNELALEYYVRACSFRVLHHGPFHASMSEALSAIASAYENKGDLDASINCFVRSVDIEIVQTGCIPNNPADLFSKLDLLSATGSSSGFDIIGSFITLAKLFVLKKSWQCAADFAIASLALAFHQRGLNPDALGRNAYNSPDPDVHPDVLRFLSDHSCLVHILVMTDRSAEILPYLPMLERIVKLNMLQMHHADSVPPVVVFHVAASEVYRAANMPARSATAMKDAIDLLQVDPGIQRRLAHAPTLHTGNLSFDPRVMARLMQSQTLLATRMKLRDEKEARVPDPLPYRQPRIPLPIVEFEIPSYGPGFLPKPDLSVLCLDIMRTLKKHGLGDKESMGRWAARAKALKASTPASAVGGRVNVGSSPAVTLPLLDVLTFALDLSSGTKGGR